MPLSAPTLLTACIALAAVLGLIWLAQRAMRTSGLLPRTVTGRSLAVEEVIAIDPRRRLHLIRCGDRRLLLLTGGAQDAMLGWLSAESAGK